MTKFSGLSVTIMLLAFAAADAQAQTPQPRPISKGPDLSDGQKKTKQGKLPRKSEIDALESRLKYLMGKIEPRVSGRKSLPWSIDRSRKVIALMESEGYWGTVGLYLGGRAPDWYQAIPDYNGGGMWTQFGRLPTWYKIFDKWIPKYKIYLKKQGKEIPSSPDLEREVWHWMIPREKAELKKLEEEYARVLKSIREIRDRLAKKKAELKRTKEAAIVDQPMRGEDIKKKKAKREETNKGRRQQGGGTSARQTPPPQCHVLGGEWRGGTLAKVNQIATNWKKELSSCTAGTDDCRSYRGQSSFGAYNQTFSIWYCHATFLKWSRKASKDDRKTARQEACAIEKTLERMADQLKATGFMKAGSSWQPSHITYLKKLELKDPCEPEKIEEAGSGSGKPPKSVAEAKPKQDCEGGGGILGATNCVTKRIGGAGGSPPKTPGKTPDGSSTTAANERPRTPASASSTDMNTGETITSVGNPDGSRTVTRTDPDGNILSRERVR